MRLLHAAGGAGKTRLGLQWARERPNHGGQSAAGFIAGALTPENVATLAAAHADLVLDYAESRPHLADLLRALATRAQQKIPGHLRLLLLARGDGDWWSNLTAADDAIGALLADGPAPLALPPVPPEDRAAQFHHAGACFQRLRGWPAPPTAPT